MLFVRPAGPADIGALLELAALSGKGFTSLPEHRPTLEDRLALSAASFAGQVDHGDAWYLLALEDSESGLVEGVGGVRARVGVQRPHFSFRVVTLAQYSSSIDTRFDHQALVLVNECSGFSEVGSLFLRPGRRQAGAGALLARSRYMLIAAGRERFADTVLAELRGWFTEEDESPFYEAVARKFFRLPFEEADRMISLTDGQFVLDLAPRHPIYIELLDMPAREAISAVHRQGWPALRLLEREGFSRSGLIDIFDGGPTLTCQRDQIATARNAQPLRVEIGSSDPGRRMLVSNASVGGFRGLLANGVRRGESLILSPADAGILNVATGDIVHACE